MPAERGTRGFHDRLAVVFDFDDTLAPATVPWLLGRLGIDDPVRWEHAHLQPYVDDDWDKLLAHGPLLRRAASERGIVLTRAIAEEAGRSLPVFDGVEAALPALRELGRTVSGGAMVDLYVLSSGFVEIMGASRAAKYFDALWGSALDWDDQDRLVGVKRAIIHSEKARYLLALAKGLDLKGADEPEDVHVEKPIDEWHVPLDQMIYVGDGLSDLDAFKLIHENGGIALGVDHSGSGEWPAADHMFASARVDNLAPADFREGQELYRSLVLAVECVSKRVALRRLASERQGARRDADPAAVS
ncbi:MAG: hypothetical protein SFX73_15910 [Kofleriaceae bacterium]|nr:hypothetical protein [Kofleriaceae bacterium]